MIGSVWSQGEYSDDSTGPYPPSKSHYNNQHAPQQYRTYATNPAAPTGPTGPIGTGPIGAGPIGGGPIGAGPIGGGPIGASGIGPIGAGTSGIGPIGAGPILPGPIGPGPIGPPFPPVGFGGLGPLRFPFLGPFGGLSPWCASLEAFRTKVYQIAEPVVVAGLSLLLVWFLKQVLLPHISVFSTAFRSRKQDVDSITARIINVVDSNVCMERIVCNLGVSAGKYSVTKPVIRMLDKTLFKSYNPLLKIFKFAATEENTKCDEFKCSTIKEISHDNDTEDNDDNKQPH